MTGHTRKRSRRDMEKTEMARNGSGAAGNSKTTNSILPGPKQPALSNMQASSSSSSSSKLVSSAAEPDAKSANRKREDGGGGGRLFKNAINTATASGNGRSGFPTGYEGKPLKLPTDTKLQPSLPFQKRPFANFSTDQYHSENLLPTKNGGKRRAIPNGDNSFHGKATRANGNSGSKPDFNPPKEFGWDSTWELNTSDYVDISSHIRGIEKEGFENKSMGKDFQIKGKGTTLAKKEVEVGVLEKGEESPSTNGVSLPGPSQSLLSRIDQPSPQSKENPPTPKKIDAMKNKMGHTVPVTRTATPDTTKPSTPTKQDRKLQQDLGSYSFDVEQISFGADDNPIEGLEDIRFEFKKTGGDNPIFKLRAKNEKGESAGFDIQFRQVEGNIMVSRSDSSFDAIAFKLTTPALVREVSQLANSSIKGSVVTLHLILAKEGEKFNEVRNPLTELRRLQWRGDEPGFRTWMHDQMEHSGSPEHVETPDASSHKHSSHPKQSEDTGNLIDGLLGRIDKPQEMTRTSKKKSSSSSREAPLPPEPGRRVTRASNRSKSNADPDQPDLTPQTAASTSAKDVVRLKHPLEKVVAIWPPGGKGAISLINGDLQRLGKEQFLNDTLIEYGLKRVLDRISQTEEGRGIAEQTHLFSSFFYKNLTSKPREDCFYESVKKWTSKTDLFSKRFVIVPINEHLHWYVAVICNPGKVLVPLPQTSPQPVVTTRRKTRQSTNSGEDQIPLSVEDVPLDQDPAMADVQGDESGKVGPSPDAKPVPPTKARPRSLTSHEDACVLIFDSFNARHSTVARVMRKYFVQEAQDKKKMPPETCSSLLMPYPSIDNLPGQDNLYDCGIWLLHYVECFLSDSESVLKALAAKQRVDPAIWKEEDVKADKKRHQLRQEVTALSKEQYPELWEGSSKSNGTTSRSKSNSSDNVASRDGSTVLAEKEQDTRPSKRPKLTSNHDSGVEILSEIQATPDKPRQPSSQLDQKPTSTSKISRSDPPQLPKPRSRSSSIKSQAPITSPLSENSDSSIMSSGQKRLRDPEEEAEDEVEQIYEIRQAERNTWDQNPPMPSSFWTSESHGTHLLKSKEEQDVQRALTHDNLTQDKSRIQGFGEKSGDVNFEADEDATSMHPEAGSSDSELTPLEGADETGSIETCSPPISKKSKRHDKKRRKIVQSGSDQDSEDEKGSLPQVPLTNPPILNGISPTNNLFAGKKSGTSSLPEKG